MRITVDIDEKQMREIQRATGHRKKATAIRQALEGRPEGLPVVLLAHQPLAAREAAEAGVDLMLAGHLHGGQIPPFHLLVRLVYGVTAGAYEIDGMTLYVSRGTGFWGPPLRVFAAPEIARVTLRGSRAGETE